MRHGKAFAKWFVLKRKTILNMKIVVFQIKTTKKKKTSKLKNKSTLLKLSYRLKKEEKRMEAQLKLRWQQYLPTLLLT